MKLAVNRFRTPFRRRKSACPAKHLFGHRCALNCGGIEKMKIQAPQYYMHDGPTAFRFELEGDLNDEGARRLEQDWRTASSVVGDRLLIVDITFVTSAAKEARILLARWHASGARLIANSNNSRALAHLILGGPLPDPPAGAHPTWSPFHVSRFLRV